MFSKISGMIIFALLTRNAVAAQPAIELRTTHCFGRCPVYELKIDSSGRCLFLGKDNVSIKGTKTLERSREELKELRKRVQELGFFKLKSKYYAPVTDQPSTFVTVKGDKGPKIVEDYYRAPLQLKQIENLIEDYCKLPDLLGFEPNLVYFAATGREQQLQRLLQSGNPSQKEIQAGFVAAVLNRWLKIADILRAKGANPDFYDDNGRSLIFLIETHRLGSHWPEEASNYLKKITVGHDPYSVIHKKQPDLKKALENFDKTRYGDALFYFAMEEAETEVLKLLIEQGYFPKSFETDRFQWLCGTGKIDKIKIIADAHDKLTKPSWSACLLRSIPFNRKVTEYSLKMGADVNAAIPGLYETTDYPLFAAIRADNPDTIQLLLDHGADINIANGNNYSGLHQACSFTSMKAVKYLIAKGSKINPRLKHNGESPLDVCRDDHKFACDADSKADGRCSQHKEIIRLLIKNGAKSFVYGKCQSK